MALTKKELESFSNAIKNAGRPLVFYDDDADGLSAFLLVQKANPDAIGIRAGRGPELDVDFVRKIHENSPDLVLVLDKPRVDPDFFRKYNTPTIWLDHHDPTTQNPDGWGLNHLTYYNPRKHNDKDGRPVSYWVWRAIQGPLWIAVIGTTADWDDSLLERFSKEHPTLSPKKITIEDALYKSPLGELVRMFNFIMKGSSKQVRKSISTIAKIESPYELLSRTTARSRFIWKHYLPILTEYEKQRQTAKSVRVKEGLFLYVFPALKHSLIAEVANEMLITKKADIILVGRNVSGEVKFSMRSHTKDLPKIVEKALEGVEGYGGGHREACGGSIREDDWHVFVEAVKKEI